MSDPWCLESIPSCDNDAPVNVEEPTTTSITGSKRSLSPSDGSPETKRIRTSYDTTKSKPKMCLAPPSNPVASKIYGQGLKAALNTATSLGAGDIFFMEGFRDRWCHCTTVSFSTLCQVIFADFEIVPTVPSIPSVSS